MLFYIALLLAIAWLLGLTAFHFEGGLIHLLLVAAVVLAVMQVLSGRRTA
jgi:hypothetical protein